MSVSADQLKEVLKKNRAVKNVDRIVNNVPLREQGVDSLDMASIFLAIEENLGVRVPDEETPKLRTIDEIVAYLSR